MSSETWKNIQENKRKRDTFRERLEKRRRERKDVLSAVVVGGDENKPDVVNDSKPPSKLHSEVITQVDPGIEKSLLQYLCISTLSLPMKSSDVLNGLNEFMLTQGTGKTKVDLPEVEFLLQKLAAQQLITVSSDGTDTDVLTIEVEKLTAVAGKNTISSEEDSQPTSKKLEKKESTERRPGKSATKRSASDRSADKQTSNRSKSAKIERTKSVSNDLDDIEALLSTKTAKEQDTNRVTDEIQELLRTASTKELSLAEKFRSLGGSQVREFCPHATREECLRNNRSYPGCQKLHFRKILKPHTDESLGDCSFLNTCFHMDTCKYVHYEIDYRGTDLDPRKHRKGGKRRDEPTSQSSHRDLLPKFSNDEDYISRRMLPPQWINCDIRYLDFSVLGKFSVIMADPPWDIHMELPYGTMQDEEMRAMRIQDLSDDGLMFLWVTGRAMELGRQLFDIWGYKRCDELIWVKTNQLQRLIRTGRTGHWINHGKEHCLIGIKGNPKGINRRLDCDVLVAEVRDTSHKPDEIYGIIERLSPGTRKLELFGRMHNIQPNWVTLGNQLDGVHLAEYDTVTKFKEKYPDGIVTKPKPANEIKF